MTTVYSIFVGDDGANVFLSKKEAVKAARKAIDSDMDRIDVDRIELVPLTLKNVVDIINSQGGRWAMSRETIMTITARKKKESES